MEKIVGGRLYQLLVPQGGRGGIRTHGWFNPTLDFESSALNRTQPPFLGKLTFGEALKAYREHLAAADMRPNTKAYREAGLKLVLRSWVDVELLNVRRITSKIVEDWLRRFKATAVPYVPNRAKTAARNSTGASTTTIKCALDAVRQVLDIAVESGHLYANPARNSTVTDAARKMFKVTRRERAERAPLRLPTREEFAVTRREDPHGRSRRLQGGGRLRAVHRLLRSPEDGSRQRALVGRGFCPRRDPASRYEEWRIPLRADD
jgi:hypothetical protein